MTEPSAAGSPVLYAEGLVHHYGQEQILGGIHLQVSPGEVVALLGPSGSGKSTLIHLIAGLERPRSGHIWWLDQEISGQSPERVSRLRARMLGIVLQQPHLVPELNTLDNVFLASLVARKGDRGRARQLLDQVGLLGRAQQYPAVLSGGERSRAALARALMSEPALLLADEPTGNLDLASSQRMMDLLVQAARASGAAVLLATHNPLLAEQADRRLYLEDGKLAQLGAPS